MTQPPSPIAACKSPIAWLDPAEPVEIEVETLFRLRAAMGAQALASRAQAAREEIGQCAAEITPALMAADAAWLAALARRVTAAATSIGQSGLAGAARNLECCALRGDPAAQGATAARLERLALKVASLIGAGALSMD